MNKEKNIKEITNELIFTKNYGTLDAVAKHLYESGYRKKEWISVEDRLPTWEDGKVLIYTTHGISIAQRTTSERWQGDLAKPKWITHWMPLPTPPKAKGGAE